MQTQEVRLVLEQKLGVISQKACGLIHQTIKKALADCFPTIHLRLFYPSFTRHPSFSRRGQRVGFQSPQRRLS